MNEDGALLRRVSWCNQLIMVTLAVSIVALVGKFDARDWQCDYDLLSLVEHTNRQVVRSHLTTGYAEKVLLLFSRSQARPEVADRYRRLKDRIADWLKAGTATTDEDLARLEPGELEQCDFTLARLILSDAGALRERPREGDVVDVHLRRHALIINGSPAEVAVDVEGEMPPLPTGLGAPSSIRLVDEGVAVTFASPAEARGGTRVIVPVTRARLDGVPPYALAPNREELGFGGADALLEKLGIDAYGPREDERLSRRYGHMSMALAKEVAATSALESYSTIPILGFEFSTRRFPVIVAALSVFLVALILRTVLSMRAARAEAADREASAVPAHARGGIHLWILAPLVSIGLSLAFAPTSRTELVAIGVGAGVILAAGLAAVVASRRM